MKTKKKYGIYAAIAVVAIFMIIIVALFGGYESNLLISDYGFLSEDGTELERSVMLYSDSEFDVITRIERNVETISVEADVQVKSIEVIIRSNGNIDKSLGVANNTKIATFADSFVTEKEEIFANAITIAGWMDNDTGLFKDVSQIDGNRVVLKIKTDCDVKISIVLTNVLTNSTEI